MDSTALLLLALGLTLGAALGWLARSGDARRAAERAVRVAELEAMLAAERAGAEEKRAIVEDARARLSDSFKAISADALRASSASFLELARAALGRERAAADGDLARREEAIAALVAPVRDALGRLDGELRSIERAREGAYGALTEQLRQVAEAQALVRGEAANLVKALRAPQARGRWGELQLRRVVELAGMLDRCDFEEQATLEGDEGRLRPDLVVHLPGGRSVVVDAKAPLSAYLEAIEARDDGARRARLADHARQLREHVQQLGRKAYWERLRPAPEFAVLFLPGESFYAAALEADPALLEASVERQVIIATPTTLIALLKAVAYGWRQAEVAENAEAIAGLGRELYKRVADLGGHFARLGRALGGTVEAYNRVVGSLEARVLPAARRFESLSAAPADAELPELPAIDLAPRAVVAPELADPTAAR